MTRKTDPELLIRILDVYTSGETNSLARVAEICGLSFSSIYQWLRDPEIIVDYMGETGISFGKAMNMARNVSKALTVSSSLENFVLNGREIPIVHHGEFSYVDDEKAIAATDDELKLGIELGYFWADRKKRDADGNRIVATRIEPCPAQLIEVYARSNMPSIYGTKTETTIKGSMSLGVTVAAAPRRPIPPEALPYATAADLEGMVIETALVTDDSEVEVYEVNSLDDLLALQLPFLKVSESMGNHDSKIVDAGSID